MELNTDTMPMLPHSLPVMAVITPIAPLWRRVMDPRVAHWRGRDAQSDGDMAPIALGQSAIGWNCAATSGRLGP